MDGGQEDYKAHVLVLAYHGQGHVNPIVQFSKRLAWRGIKVTVTAALSNIKKLQHASSGSITFEPIYDDETEGGPGGPGGFRGFLDRFKSTGSKNLTELIKKHHNSDQHPVKCLIYDANIEWAALIAEEMGILSAAFFTQSCAAIASYYPMHCEVSKGGHLACPAFSMPGLPEIRAPHLPSLGSDNVGGYPPVILHILGQFRNIDKADWVLFNSFYKLEEEVVKWMSNLWPVRTIGPCVPSFFLDKRIKEDNGYGFNVFNPDMDACTKWLDCKETGSVVYVSVGSVTLLSAEQMAEIGRALKQLALGLTFLWVVKPTEEKNLPLNFKEETSEKGLVVTWCSQLEVLAHPAVGCFVSHCGWNSSVEAISFGVPVIAMPQFLDQITNAYFFEHVWGAGIRAEADEKGFTTCEELGRCIDEVMNGEKGKVVKENAFRWKELAKEAIDEGGSSDKYIEEIIARINIKAS